ncbi:ankyrin repeat domain-containing protein [Mesorhizobium sp. M0092]|uniref:ankyrin repeat domain-containing protein n=1 Tax=Mesorhizobium sp. M0092 TaxID=2956876 RepID=UPI00333D286E
MWKWLATALALFLLFDLPDSLGKAKAGTDSHDPASISLIFSILSRDVNGVTAALKDGAVPTTEIYINYAGGQTYASALMISVLLYEEQIINLLTDAGAFDPQACLNAAGLSLIDPVNSILPAGVPRASVQRYILGQSALKCFLDKGRYRVDPAKHSQDLLRAIANGDLGLANTLIKSGVDLSVPEDSLPGIGQFAPTSPGRAAIHIAILERQTELVKMLLDFGADPNIKAHVGSVQGGWDGFTPLMLAAVLRDQDTARLLLDRGADLLAEDARGWQAANHAAVSSTSGMLELLFAAASKAQVEKMLTHRTHAGETVLSLAARAKALQNLYFLIQTGETQIGASFVKKFGSEALVEAATTRVYAALGVGEIENARQNSGDAVTALVKAGADVEAVDEFGSTVLMISVRDGLDIRVISDILASGADSNAIDLSGHNVDFYSSERADSRQIRELLVAYRAKVH